MWEAPEIQLDSVDSKQTRHPGQRASSSSLPRRTMASAWHLKPLPPLGVMFEPSSVWCSGNQAVWIEHGGMWDVPSVPCWDVAFAPWISTFSAPKVSRLVGVDM